MQTPSFFGTAFQVYALHAPNARMPRPPAFGPGPSPGACGGRARTGASDSDGGRRRDNGIIGVGGPGAADGRNRDSGPARACH